MRNAALAMIPRLASRFMAVARPAKKTKGGSSKSNDGEPTSRFFSTPGSAAQGREDVDDFGSMFLAPPLAPRTPTIVRSARRLRARFRARNFLRPPWLR